MRSSSTSSRSVCLRICLAASVLVAAAGCRAPSALQAARPPEPENPPFTITNLHAEDRVLSFDLSYTPTVDIEAYAPIGMLVVYCYKKDFDVRLIGLWRGGEVWAFRDDLLGVEQICSSIWDGAPKEHLGSWWHVPSDEIDWTQREQVRIRLGYIRESGHIEGSGYMIVAMVSGRIGGPRMPFVLLSDPVITPYTHVPPAPEGS